MIKYLIIILILLSAITIKAQLPSGFPTQANTGWTQWGYQQSTMGTIIATRDTNWTPRYCFTVVGWPNPGVDTAYWMWDCSKWKKISTSSDIVAPAWGNITGTLSNQTDLQNALNLKFNIFDTANKWVQNVYARNDSIYRFKNGVESLVTVITSTTLNNIGAGFRWAATPSGNVKTVFASNTILWDSTSNTNGLTPKVDTGVIATQYDLTQVSGQQGLQDVITNDPRLYASDTIDQNSYRIYFTNGPFESDSIIYTPTESFISTDSILGVGHSIANQLGASTLDSNFIGKAHLYFNKPWANWAQVSAGITRVVWQHNTNTGPEDHRATVAMGALNSIRSGWTNIKTYRKIVNAYKSIFVNQFALVQDSASGANVTRAGSGWATYSGQADAAKFNTTSYTNVQNDSATYVFNGPGVGVVMMGTDGSGGQYVGSDVLIRIDGVTQGTFSTNNQTDGVADFISGFPGLRSPMAFVFYGLRDTTHTITVVNTQSSYMYIDYFATFVNPTDAYPLVLMHEPYMDATGYAGLGSNALINSFNRGIDSMVAALPHNFPIRVGKTNTVYNAGATTPDISGDGLHPNNLGHREIWLYGLLPAIEFASPGKVFFTNNNLYLNDGTQSRKIYDTLNLVDATSTQRGLVGTADQTWDGTKTFLDDIVVNTVSIGAAGIFSSNTRVGNSSLSFNNGDNGNSAFGQSSLAINSTGYFNTAIGRLSLSNVTTGNSNTAVGHQAGNLNTGSGNIFLGVGAGGNHTTGSNKLYISNNDAATLIYGDILNGRVVINGGPSSSPSDNAIGSLQVNGPITVSSHPVAGNSDSAITWNRITNQYEISRINSGAVTTLYTGNSTLTSDRTVNTGGFTTTWTGSNDSETSFSVVNTGTTGANAISGSTTGATSIGVSGSSSAYIGVYGSSTTNNGVQGESSSGTGVIGISATGAAFRGQTNPSSNNAIENILTLLRTSSSGAGANNIGAAIQYELETATNGTSQIAGSIAYKWTDATNATRTSQLEIYGVNSSTTARKAALAGSGQWTWDGYGAGTFTGTPTFTLQATSAGAIIEGPLIASGTYTPTLTNETNIASSTPFQCQYLRVGNTVTVSGKITVDYTATGNSSLGISLPIGSAIGNDYEVAGTMNAEVNNPGVIRGDATNDRAQFFINTSSSASYDYYFTFTYLLL